MQSWEQNIPSLNVRVNTTCNPQRKVFILKIHSQNSTLSDKEKEFHKSFLFLHFMNQKGHKPNLKKTCLAGMKGKMLKMRCGLLENIVHCMSQECILNIIKLIQERFATCLYPLTSPLDVHSSISYWAILKASLCHFHAILLIFHAELIHLLNLKKQNCLPLSYWVHVAVPAGDRQRRTAGF